MAEDDAGDDLGVGEHHAGREQHGKDGFHQRADHERDHATEGASHARNEDRADHGEDLRQEQQREDEGGEDQALGVAIDLQPAIDWGAVVGIIGQTAVGAILVPRVRKSFGGMIPLVIGSLMETILSMLLAPCVMIAHTKIVASIVLGQAVGWGTQNRDADGTSWGEAATVHAMTTLLGIGWAALAWYISPVYAAWMSPILLGLILSIPVSVWTSRARWGKALLKNKILATPEELNPPTVMQLADVAKASIDPALDATTTGRHGVVAAVVDPYVNGVHVSLLEPGEMTPGQEAVVERCLMDGFQALSKGEQNELLYDAPGMLMLHRAVWLRPAEGIHATWTQAVESYRRRLDAGYDGE